MLLMWRLNTGYNQYTFPNPKTISKGSIIYIDNKAGATIHLDTSGSALYSDYIMNGYLLTPLNPNTNYRFYFNCLISSWYYLSSYSFTHQYSLKGALKVTGNFIDNTNVISRLIMISKINAYINLNRKILLIL